MEILYNNTDKEVVIILGYGIGSHLSVNYLVEITKDIKQLFPQLTDEQLNELRFMEVNQNSCRYKYHWYTRFNYHLGQLDGTFHIGAETKGYAFSDYPGNKNKRPAGYDKPESAKDIMNRLIHD